MNKQRKKLLAIILPLCIVFALMAAMLGYMCTFYKAVDVDEYLTSNNDVDVQKTKYGYYFDGMGEKDAFVFYPGAKVDEAAYAPILYQLAQAGVDCYLIKMPFHMAIFNVKAADKVIDDSHQNWYIGGHSMGGAMAASYLAKSQKEINGIVFFAAYSATDLKDKDVRALSIYGSLDGVLNMDHIAKGRDYFANYQESVITGGNHALFGSYGKQSGDNDAAIMAVEQWQTTTGLVLEFIKGVKA